MNVPTTDGCLEADAALSLVQVLSQDGTPGLSHISECGECRARIDEWRQIEGALRERAVRPGFEEQVLANLPAASRPEASSWGWGLLNAALTFAVAASVLIVLKVAPGPATLLGLAGTAAVGVWSVTLFGRDAA